MYSSVYVYFFFFNDTATTQIYTLSLHDALPISNAPTRPTITSAIRIGFMLFRAYYPLSGGRRNHPRPVKRRDRKSTRLNSSHSQISYAVFCLKKKKKHPYTTALVQPLPIIRCYL